MALASTFSLSSNVPISLSPSSQKTSQLSIICKRKSYSIRKPSISCKVTNGDGPDGDTFSMTKFDRRDLLVSLGGLYGVAILASDPFALAAPIEAPDFSKCGKANLPEGAKPTNCWPTSAATIKDYEFPKYKTMRVRSAAHLADGANIAKYDKAIKLMKTLPDSGPRSFTQQANVHCAYCDGAYHLVHLYHHHLATIISNLWFSNSELIS